MWSKVNSLSGIQNDFLLKDEFVIYPDFEKEKIIKFDYASFQKIWEIDNAKHFPTLVAMHQLYLEDFYSNLVELDFDLGRFNRSFDFKLRFNKIIRKERIIIFKKESRETAVFSLEQDKILTTLQTDKRLVVFCVIDEQLMISSIFREGFILQAFNLDSGHCFWTLDLSALELFAEHQIQDRNIKINRVVGVFQQQLYLSCNSKFILAIDLQTGELLRYWHQYPEDILPEAAGIDHLLAPTQTYIDQESGKLIGLIRWYYWEIDLVSGQMVLEDLEAAFRAEKVEVRPRGILPCRGDHLYFASEYLENPGDDNWLAYKRIGAFNRRTKKIDWTYLFDSDSHSDFQIEAPIRTDTHLLAMDNRNNLHIFKKDTA